MFDVCDSLIPSIDDDVDAWSHIDKGSPSDSSIVAIDSDPDFDHTPSSVMVNVRLCIIRVIYGGIVDDAVHFSTTDTLHSRNESQYGPTTIADVDYWVGCVVNDPVNYWCWRVNFNKDLTVSDFRPVDINEQLWLEDDTGYIVIERKDQRALAWLSHSWKHSKVYWSPDSGWAAFVLDDPTDTVSDILTRLGLLGYTMSRLVCPLRAVRLSGTKSSEWVMPMGRHEKIFRGSASLTGCFLLHPTQSSLPALPCAQPRLYCECKDCSATAEMECDEILDE